MTDRIPLDELEQNKERILEGVNRIYTYDNIEAVQNIGRISQIQMFTYELLLEILKELSGKEHPE